MHPLVNGIPPFLDRSQQQLPSMPTNTERTMSLLGDIADAVGIGTTGIPWGTVASVGGSLLQSQGVSDTNQANMQIAMQNSAQSAAMSQQQMDFQAAQNQKAMDYSERMSNTSYQRGVKDMEAAGLNPMLAYQQGGASAPTGVTSSGSQGQVFTPQLNNKWAGAAQSASTIAQIENTKADTEVKNTQADINREEQKKKIQDTITSAAQAGHLDALKDSVRQEMGSYAKRMEKLDYETMRARGERELPYYEIRRRERELQLDFPDLQQLKTKAELLGLDVPEALAYSRFWKSAAGAAKPYTDYGTASIGKLVGSAAEARRAFR